MVVVAAAGQTALSRLSFVVLFEVVEARGAEGLSLLLMEGQNEEWEIAGLAGMASMVTTTMDHEVPKGNSLLLMGLVHFDDRERERGMMAAEEEVEMEVV